MQKSFKKDFHNNDVQKPSSVFVLLFPCGAFSVSPFTRNLCFGFAVTLCDNARSVRGVCAVHKLAQMPPAFFLLSIRKNPPAAAAAAGSHRICVSVVNDCAKERKRV